jgi:hypothetical protein
MDKESQDGFKNFARIPNILFVSFRHLSREEKFLYCTLKSIYWDAKTRYVSLRELGETAGYSTGALSKMLPRLHTCGLVNAKIQQELDKKGRAKGNPKYQITVLDIWELNTYYHSCSANERDMLDPSLKLVQQMNEPVHESTQGHSPNDTSSFTKDDKPDTFDEQDQAQNERAKDKKDSLKTSLKKEERTITQPSASLSFSSPEEAERYEWIRQEKVTCPKDQAKVIEYVQALLSITSRDQLHRLKEVARAEIPGTNKKVFLGNLVSSLDGFLQAEQANTPAPLETPSQGDIEALAASILREYPEIVLVVKSDEYGPCIEMPNGEPFADGVRDAEDWRILRSDTHRLAQVLAYGRQRVMVA